jgi:hypothetical protein
LNEVGELERVLHEVRELTRATVDLKEEDYFSRSSVLLSVGFWFDSCRFQKRLDFHSFSEGWFITEVN